MDFDGVIVKSEYMYFKTFNKLKVSNNFKITYPQWKRKFAGRGLDYIVDNIAGEIGFSDSIVKTIKNKWIDIFKNEIKSKPLPLVRGIKNFYNFLRVTDTPHIIASGSDKEIIKSTLQHYNIFNSRIIYDSSNKLPGKPHSDIFIQANKKINIPARNCLVVEDTPPGIIAGKNGGFLTVALTTTFSRSFLEKIIKNWIYDDFEDLMNYLEYDVFIN